MDPHWIGLFQPAPRSPSHDELRQEKTMDGTGLHWTLISIHVSEIELLGYYYTIRMHPHAVLHAIRFAVPELTIRLFGRQESLLPKIAAGLHVVNQHFIIYSAPDVYPFLDFSIIPSYGIISLSLFLSMCSSLQHQQHF